MTVYNPQYIKDKHLHKILEQFQCLPLYSILVYSVYSLNEKKKVLFLCLIAKASDQFAYEGKLAKAVNLINCHGDLVVGSLIQLNCPILRKKCLPLITFSPCT